jgi:hypothetical protein
MTYAPSAVVTSKRVTNGRTISHPAVLLLACTLAASSPSVALGGLLKLSVDVGSKAKITIVDFPKGAPAVTRPAQERTDTNNDKIIEFSLDPESEIGFVTVEKISDGKPLKYTIQVNIAGVTLASLEPFELPTFAGVAGALLVAEFDTAEFLAEGLSFNVGDVIPVSGGSITETSNIVFADEFGSPFSGSAVVQPFDVFLASPEPSTLSILALGLLGIAGWNHKRKRIALCGAEHWRRWQPRL